MKNFESFAVGEHSQVESKMEQVKNMIDRVVESLDKDDLNSIILDR